MILVDTSVLINFFRGRETLGTKYLEILISEEQPFCINEFIYQELLQGSKDEKEFSTLKSYLSEIPLYSLNSEFSLMKMPRASILDAEEKVLQFAVHSIYLLLKLRLKTIFHCSTMTKIL